MWTKKKIKVAGYYWLRDNEGKEAGLKFLTYDANPVSTNHPDFWQGWYWDEPIICPPIDLKEVEESERIEQKDW